MMSFYFTVNAKSNQVLCFLVLMYVVGVVGLEPTWFYNQQSLSLSPIPVWTHPRLFFLFILYWWRYFCTTS